MCQQRETFSSEFIDFVIVSFGKSEGRRWPWAARSALHTERLVKTPGKHWENQSAALIVSPPVTDVLARGPSQRGRNLKRKLEKVPSCWCLLTKEHQPAG